ncbi:MAG: FecR domain-containing protein [Balneolaceae bacterium]|nr:FecR domain-containing protein [Balneolaceae bacterium]
MEIKHIHRYLAGEASPDERKALERWLEESEENKNTFEAFREIYEVEIGYRFSYDKEAALEKFREVMNDSKPVRRKTPLRKIEHRKPSRLSTWVKAAAVLIIAAGISIYMFTALDESEDVRIVDAATGTTIETEAGEQKSFRLSDGSRIKLNASSRIYISSGFGELSREVDLQGEAFFEVAEMDGNEFVVETSSARVQVLGTSFAVRAWEGRSESVVAVQSGTVSVGSTNPEIIENTILNAGEYSLINKNEAPGPAIQSNIDQYLGWTNQMFVFEETPLEDVIRQLELHFNVIISVQDSSTITDPVTARYRNESLDEILRFTSITHGVDFTVEVLHNNNNNNQ